MSTKKLLIAGVSSLLAFTVAIAWAEETEHMHQGVHQSPVSSPKDNRKLVAFPEEVRRHTLANMRDHLLALEQIQGALGKGDFDTASDIAEGRLGMTSLRLHGAHDLAPYMPDGMRNIGTAMHQAASKFALVAKDANVTGDAKSVFSAFSQVMHQCVACHSSYRVQ